MKIGLSGVSLRNLLPLACASCVACGGEGTASRPADGAAFPSVAGAADGEGSGSAAVVAGEADDGGEASSGSPSSPGEGVVSSNSIAAPAEPQPGGEAANAEQPAEGGGRFVLAWQDDFDAFDASRWQLMTHSWDSNLAQFSTSNASFEGGVASLRLTAEASDPAKPYRGVEMRSRDALTYGKVEARARFAGGSGVVSSLVLIYTPWPADDWNELDIEFLGRYSDRIQCNAMVYTGEPTTPPVTTSVSPTQHPQIVAQGFDPAADFHVYAIEWTPNEARFRVDGAVVHRWSEHIDRMRLPQNVLMTVWASSAAGWAGPLDADSVPTAAEYDWLRVYDWVPE